MKPRQQPQRFTFTGTVFKPVEVKKEPRFIKLADNTPNPYGKIAPPNTPVNGVRRKK